MYSSYRVQTFELEKRISELDLQVFSLMKRLSPQVRRLRFIIRVDMPDGISALWGVIPFLSFQSKIQWAGPYWSVMHRATEWKQIYVSEGMEEKYCEKMHNTLWGNTKKRKILPLGGLHSFQWACLKYILYLEYIVSWVDARYFLLPWIKIDKLLSWCLSC